MLDQNTIKGILKTLHIGGAVVTGVIIIGVGATMYRNYFEIKKLRLDIKRLNQLLAAPVFPPHS